MKTIHLFFAVLLIGAMSACQKEVSFENADAVGTLVTDGSGDCLPIVVNGTYTVNSPLSNANSIDIQVNFSQIGAYNITSDTLNGYSFSAVGNANTGIHTVHLVATGTPTTLGSGVDVFQINYGGGSCSFSIVLNAGSGSIPVVGTMSATVNGTAKTFNISDSAKFDNTGSTPTLELFGSNAAGEQVDINIELPSGSSIAAGSYNVNANTYLMLADYKDASGTDFSAQSLSANPTPVFQVLLNNSVSGASGTLSGTFSGALKEAGGTVATLTNGTFQLNVGPF